MIKNKWVQKLNKDGQSENPKYNWQTNCWGSTVLFHEPNLEPDWFDASQMEVWLKDFTERVYAKDLKQGDIFVMRNKWGELIHTGIYIAKNLVWHKPGANPALFETLDDAKVRYSDDDEIEYNWHTITYRRFIK